MQVLNISMRGVLGTKDKSKSHDCKSYFVTRDIKR